MAEPMLIPPDPDQHLMAISKITSDAFAGGEYVDEISQQYIGSCHYDWDTSRLIFDRERLIHHWGVWGYPMRLGSVQVKVAGIGAVVTEKAYRKQGMMQMAAEDSIKAMQENDYDLSILRGRHYVKLGYARAWNYVTYRLEPEEIPDLTPKLPYEMLAPDKMDQINTIYNQFHRDFSGTTVRPTYRMLEAEDMRAYGWLDEQGNLAGYVRAVPTEDKKTLQCLEAAGDPQQGLAVLAAIFKAGEYETLTFFTLPQNHPILQNIRRGACVVENRYFHNTGWRVRIVNLQSTLEKMHPDLEARLERSSFANWRGSLHLDAGEQRATLKMNDGKMDVYANKTSENRIRGGADLARFLIGSDDPLEIIQQSQMACTGKAVELVSVLFPNQYPVMCHWDEY